MLTLEHDLLLPLATMAFKNKDRPNLAGVHVAPRGGFVSLYATDGHRAARVDIETPEYDGLDDAFTVSAHGLKTVLQAAGKKGFVTLYRPVHGAGVPVVATSKTAGDATFTLNEIDGKFPDVDRAAFGKVDDIKASYKYDAPTPAFDASYVKDAADFMQKVTGRKNAPLFIRLMGAGEVALFTTDTEAVDDLKLAAFAVMPLRA